MSAYNSSHVLESKKVKRKDDTPVDTGLIRCVCPSTEDDGFTIQCERCLVWQHAYCVNITHATIPDHYLCDQCCKRKRPKLSKRIPISKTKLQKLDSEDDPLFNKKKKHVKSRIVSRYVHPIFREAKERWSRWKQHEGHLLYDHGPFVTMDTTTLLTKGLLLDTPTSNQGIIASRTIPSLRYLMQVTGDVLLKSEFKFDPINDYVILGTPLSHMMFYPTLDLCIDTRQFGNKARYIRRSCHPNAELRNVVLPRDDKMIHLGLFARHLIERGQEITISWGWQRGHIAWKENMNWHHQHKLKGQDNEGHQVIDEEEERRRKSTIKNMLDRFEKEFGSCACLNKRRCLIEHLKRQIAPPKEKAVFKLPAVNILPRRKSAVILLKPKPQIKSDPITRHKSGEESLDIDVTSNSPTLAAKETSDDELVDVEGDIDVGDDLPATTKDTLPLLDDNSSDEENADLSSLSSLSSLSVFEESANDNSEDEENRAKLRRKKHASRHAKSSRSHHRHHHHHHQNSASSSSGPALEKNASGVLPRKKLWMRDYLNKSIPDAILSSVDASPEDIEAAKLLLDAMAANEIPMHRPRNDTVMADFEEAEDEGELSDASTILLDQEELQEAYRRTSYDAGVAEGVVQNGVNNVAEVSQAEESVEKTEKTESLERTESPAGVVEESPAVPTSTESVRTGEANTYAITTVAMETDVVSSVNTNTDLITINKTSTVPSPRESPADVSVTDKASSLTTSDDMVPTSTSPIVDSEPTQKETTEKKSSLFD
ncbi:hypothetical protein INT48_001139 [Thamnidium elegans]|uniref:SET domain-containing protein n=1 Tax=Thamnidium elegans TaxID=101142 RepID=A0A8H7VRJ0_9FUNG|nr:hypothetical protein INT48_001139 [Thamnidium elegans]